MRDMNLMRFLLKAICKEKGIPDPNELLKLREDIHKTIPNWQHLIGFCLCMLDDVIRDSGGKMTRKEICDLWLGANEEDER